MKHTQISNRDTPADRMYLQQLWQLAAESDVPHLQVIPGQPLGGVDKLEVIASGQLMVVVTFNAIT